MGPGITVAKVISTFESVYDYVDTKESVLGKLFNCKQWNHENITDFAGRVEELYSHAETLDGLKQRYTRYRYIAYRTFYLLDLGVN